MTRFLSCDEVFEQLTGTLCSRANEAVEVAEQLDEHLAVCPECRRLAETLRPAVELLQDGSLPVALWDKSWSVDWERMPARVEVAPEAGMRPDRRESRSASGVSPSSWQLVAVALLGALMGGWWMQATRGPAEGEAGHRSWSGWGVEHSDDSWSVASLGLAEACRPSGRVSSAETGHVQSCCSRCHASQSPHAPPVEFSRLVVACLTCHNGS
ncbi:MAG: hypothetical protein U0935_23360 [Pirellulales bacterium]